MIATAAVFAAALMLRDHSYVSRLLSMLDREALVERGERGLVVGVDWQNLLRVRAESYQVFGTNEAHGFISGQGVREVVRRLLADPATIYGR